MITFEDVTKFYAGQDRPALRNINLEIAKGEFVFLVGQSGSGKSTFLRLILREYRPTKGTLYVAGKNLSTLNQWKVPALRRQIGTVFQDFRLLPGKTVYENVAFALQVIGKSSKIIRRVVPETLRLVGLEGKENRLNEELSGGEQQRIGILRAIAAKPDILLMDEPFSALDPLARASLQETVSLIHKKLGTTIVFVTHDMNEAAKLACRIGVMHQGRLVQVDTPQDIQNHPADDYVRSLFGAAQPENTISADKVINLYRRLDADGKARVREYWAQNRMDV